MPRGYPNDPLYREFANRFRRLREQLGLSQESVAKALGLQQSQVHRMEHLDRRMDVVEFLRVCQLFQKPPSAFLSFPKEAPAKPKKKKKAGGRR